MTDENGDELERVAPIAEDHGQGWSALGVVLAGLAGMCGRMVRPLGSQLDDVVRPLAGTVDDAGGAFSRSFDDVPFAIGEADDLRSALSRGAVDHAGDLAHLAFDLGSQGAEWAFENALVEDSSSIVFEALGLAEPEREDE